MLQKAIEAAAVLGGGGKDTRARSSCRRNHALQKAIKAAAVLGGGHTRDGVLHARQGLPAVLQHLRQVVGLQLHTEKKGTGE